MDFASMILRNLEGLAHVGGVVIASEDERLKNLFKLLAGELASRKRVLLDAGVSSFAAYLEAGHTDLPHLYLSPGQLLRLPRALRRPLRGRAGEPVPRRHRLRHLRHRGQQRHERLWLQVPDQLLHLHRRSPATTPTSTAWSSTAAACVPKNVPGRARSAPLTSGSLSFQSYLGFARASARGGPRGVHARVRAARQRRQPPASAPAGSPRCRTTSRSTSSTRTTTCRRRRCRWA